MAVAEDTVARNRALQTEWYGEPLGDRVRPLLDRLGLSQSGLAGVLGLSAPMLSQLMSGQRAKISNPAVLHRLLAVEELVGGPGFDALTAAEIKDRLARIRAETAATTSNVRVAAEGRDDAPAGRGPAESARLVQTVLREVASASEIEAAAELLADRFPDLAEVLRVYGTGRASEAEAHFIRKIVNHVRSE
ncbi:XRE family transcriptional regulator [Actinomadura sp. GC306]|uniref:helix-turn-helix domain-containing protein n=1 Tax=Actinomadura sp. GC306 TaxID=2530367 RepID=UPI001046ACC5|nr:helix-turn-helix transcriptional regulator [Actinomadura sp. GC306]TDC67863.1 XRE family transcriptional regulator [Actinomadura sp. GC306]